MNTSKRLASDMEIATIAPKEYGDRQDERASYALIWATILLGGGAILISFYSYYFKTTLLGWWADFCIAQQV